MRHVHIAVCVLLLASSALVRAQWPNHRAPAIPTLPDGTPDLMAPAPRGADGKPDLSGLWFVANNSRAPLFNLRWATQPGDIVMTPWTAAVQAQRERRSAVDDPWGLHCMPLGTPRINFSPGGMKVVMAPALTVVLFDTEVMLTFRQIFTDGRPLPGGPIEPTWLGYSVGRWEGDTFVVETTGLRDGGWLDTRNGYPHSDAVRLTERFHRVNVGRMDLTVTIDDPKAYVKPWSYRTSFALRADSELIESFCESHAKTMEHRVVDPAPPKPPSPEWPR